MEQWLEQTPLLGDSELREVGNLICEKRKARGWSQNDLAGYLGSDYRVVSRHENGHGMNLESLVRYSQVFSCPITALLPKSPEYSFITAESLMIFTGHQAF